MRIRIKGEGVFEADDINDAFLRLADHFLQLALKGIDAEDFFEPGTDLNIEPVGDNS